VAFSAGGDGGRRMPLLSRLEIKHSIGFRKGRREALFARQGSFVQKCPKNESVARDTGHTC
jgi:hypothetical protein